MAIDPGSATLGAAAIDAGSNIFSTLLQNQFNKRQQTRANNDNLLFNQWQFERANDYNHPSAQMQRLAEAHLNPNLIYSSGAAIPSAPSISGAPAKPAASSQFRGIDALSAVERYYSAKNMEEQNKNLQAQNAVLRSDGLLRQAQADIAKHDADVIGQSPFTSQQLSTMSWKERSAWSFVHWLRGKNRPSGTSDEKWYKESNDIVDGMFERRYNVKSDRSEWRSIPVDNVK